MSGKSVFISYSSRDRESAIKIRRLLESDQVRVWLDVIDIRTTNQLQQELFDSIDKQDIFCLLPSPSSVESPWVLREIEYAKTKEGLQILPITLRSCSIPDSLGDIVGLDAREGFDSETVRLRLLRAIHGKKFVEDSVLLDKAERELLAKAQILERAEKELPQIAKTIDPLSSDPIRQIELQIDVASLPEDDDIILELSLTLDLFKGSMSIFIARYREGHTWPAQFRFEEPEYTDYYLKDTHRVDVQFRWYDCVQKLRQHIADVDAFPATFTLTFDGRELRPGGEFSLPANFEIPCVNTLVKKNHFFTLIAHNSSTGTHQDISPDTDIKMELHARVQEQTIRLYRSFTTYKQAILLDGSFLRADSNTIHREIVLNRYDLNSSLSKQMRAAEGKRREEITAALETLDFNWHGFAFESIDEHRLTARERFKRAGTFYSRELWRDAYRMYQDTAELFFSLSKTEKLSLRDGTMMFLSTLRLVTTWTRQNAFDNAGKMVFAMKNTASDLAKLNPAEPDCRRFCADAALANATVQAKLGRIQDAASELATAVDIYEKLNTELKSPARRLAWLEVLRTAVKRSDELGLQNDQNMDEWETKLTSEIGEEAKDQVLRVQAPGELPVWLQKVENPNWPTKRIHSSTLRYSLRIVERWNDRPLVRGTEFEIEHIYWGDSAQDAEWLVNSFMDNSDLGGAHKWVPNTMMLCRFPLVPIHDKAERGPEIWTWQNLGSIPALQSKLQADEVYGYMGVAKYKRSYVMLGRIYVVVVRRGKFAWKIALSFKTACRDGMREEVIVSNDHVRAGAILGDMELDGTGIVSPPTKTGNSSAKSQPSPGSRAAPKKSKLERLFS
jgi:TIR domain